MQHTALQSDLEAAREENSRPSRDPISWLPDSPPRHSLQSHTGAVNCIAFHPTFSSIASGSDDCTIKVWDWEFGELERTIKGHTQAVRDVDFGGPKVGVLLASCSSDLAIKLWDPSNNYKNIRTMQGHDHAISSIRFIPCGVGNGFANLLASTSGDRTLRVWNVDTGHCIKTLRGHADWVRSVCPSVNGQFLLSASNDKTACLWDISVPQTENMLTLVGHNQGINCCALAPATSYPYLAKMANIKTIPAASSPAEFIATGSRDRSIKLWDRHGTCLKTLMGHDNWISNIAFHPGGKFLLSVADDKTLRCWDLAQGGQCVKVLEGLHTQFITCLRWAPGATRDDVGLNGDGKRVANEGIASSKAQVRCVVATGSMDMTVKIFTE